MQSRRRIIANTAPAYRAIRCRAAVLLLALLALPLLRAQTPAVPGDNRVRGVVVDSLTGAPIARALVSADNNSYATLTNNEGRFAFEPQSNPAGDAGQLGRTIRVVRPGYLEDGRLLMLRAGAESILRVTPESVLAGHITAAGVDSPSGIIVQLLRRKVERGRANWQPRDTKLTDSNGDVRFANLPGGEYRLVTREWNADPPGNRQSDVTVEYPPVSYPADRSGTHLATGVTVRVEMALRPATYYAVHLPIANLPTGGGASVTVEETATGTEFALGFDPRLGSIEGSLPNGNYTVTASANGIYLLHADASPLPNGKYTVTFNGNGTNTGGATATTQFTVHDAPVRTGALPLVPNSDIAVVVHEEFTGDASRPPADGGAASGNLGPGQERLPRVYVNLRPEKPGRPAGEFKHVAGRPDDEWQLSNVAPGRYFAEMHATRGYVAAASAGGVDLETSPLTVGADGNAPTIQVTLRDDTGTLKGTVHMPDTESGDGQQRGFVFIYPFGHLTMEQVVLIQADNSFEAQFLPPGRYLVLASSSTTFEEPEFRNEEVLRALGGRAVLVNVQPGGSATVELSLVDEASR